jgi:hypothetical protein
MEPDMCDEHDREGDPYEGDDFSLVDPDEEELDEDAALWGAESDELPSARWDRPTE